MGLARSDTPASDSDTGAKYLYTECHSERCRIKVAERVSAIVEILTANDQTDFAQWSDIFLSALNEKANPEQLPSLRCYGPDSTGWLASEVAKSKKLSILS
jgi:hypothetical protein